MWPDIEAVVADLLAPFVAANHVGTVTPADLEAQLPWIRVNRYGGPDDGVTDRAAVDVDCYGSTRTQAIDLARQVHAFLVSGRHKVGAVLIDQVRTDVGVSERPRSGTTRRFGGTYTISARRLPA